MMNPVVRVLVQRAAARRHSLLELVRAIPDDYLERVAPGEEWCALDHLVHALAIDGPMEGLFLAVANGANSIELGTTMSQVAGERSDTLRVRRLFKLEELIEVSLEERQRLVESVARLRPQDLDALIPIPGERNAWGDPLGITLFQYLEQWSSHDSVHEESIRFAIATRPDLSTVALTRRLR